MTTEKAREILDAVEAQERALNNLRNAASMGEDEPRATQLLEEAGDAYAAATVRLATIQVPLRSVTPLDEDVSDAAEGAEPPPPATETPQGAQTPPLAAAPADGATSPPADPGTAEGAEASEADPPASPPAAS